MTADEKTRLDLAGAYVEMGDFEGARQVLRELVAEGSGEAGRVLAKLHESAAPVEAAPAAQPKPFPPRAEPPANPAGEAVHIAEFHSGGLILGGEGKPDGPTIRYAIVDGATERWLDSEEFVTYAGAQTRIAERFTHVPRWRPPPASEEEHAQMKRLMLYMESGGADRWKNGRRSDWAYLTYYLHQRTHRPELEARLRALLVGNPYGD